MDSGSNVACLPKPRLHTPRATLQTRVFQHPSPCPTSPGLHTALNAGYARGLTCGLCTRIGLCTGVLESPELNQSSAMHQPAPQGLAPSDTPPPGRCCTPALLAQHMQGVRLRVQHPVLQRQRRVRREQQPKVLERFRQEPALLHVIALRRHLNRRVHTSQTVRCCKLPCAVCGSHGWCDANCNGITCPPA